MNTMQAATSVKSPISGLAAGPAGPSPAAAPGAVNGSAAVPPGGTDTLGGAGDAISGAASTLGDATSTLGNAAASASGLGQTDSLFTWGSYFQALSILFLIVAILFVALWFLKRRGGIKILTRPGGLHIESRMPLGPKKSLLVVRFLNKRVLLGVTDQQITMLTELPTDEDATTTDPASETPGAADFAAHLAGAAPRAPEKSG